MQHSGRQYFRERSGGLTEQMSGVTRREKARDELMHAIEIDWFGQVTIHARIVSSALKAFSAKGSDCNHRNLSQCFEVAYSACCRQAVQLRQIDIHQNQVGICLRSYFDCIFAVTRSHNSVILLLEIEADHCEVIGGIVDDEY